MENIIKVLRQFEKENVFYWIKALVNQKEITKAQAGYLIKYFSL